MSDLPTSDKVRRFANAQFTSDALIPLLTLNHETFDQPGRIARNTADVVSRGMLFQSLSFDIIWPNMDGKSVPSFQVTVDVVDTNIRRSIQLATSPVRVDLEVVLASDPDVVEIGIVGVLVLRDVQWDDFTLTGSLMLEDVMQQIVPGDVYDPVQFPGIF